jgi:hypothetical protein
MNIINVYGCSWTHGIQEDNFDSWVTELGKLLPNYQINNYAVQGSSIAFSCWMLEKTFNSSAITIFQCTMPARFSYWENFDFEKYQFKKNNNVTCFSNDIPVKRILVGMKSDDKTKGHVNNTSVKKFMKEYYSRLTDPLLLIEWKSYIEFAAKRSSYIFTHKPHEINNHVSNLDNIGNILGEKIYVEFIQENDNYHFGLAGQKWQADFVYKKLLEKKLLDK